MNAKNYTKLIKNFYETMDLIYNLRNNIPDKYNRIIAVKTNELISLNNFQKIGIIEIEAIMDFIKGKLDNENYSKIKCSYISNDLGNELTNVLYNKNISDKKNLLKNSNFLYSIDENQLKKLDSKSKSMPPTNKNNNYNLKNKKGGKTKINKKIKHKKTRKNI